MGFIIPKTDSQFLSDILSSIKRRSKSLNYHCEEVSVEKVIEHYDNERVEKVEIELKPYFENCQLYISIWEDRQVHISCGQRTKEIKWNWEIQGKYLTQFGGKIFVDSIEQTRDYFFEMNPKNTKNFNIIWDRLVSTGLRIVE